MPSASPISRDAGGFVSSDGLLEQLVNLFPQGMYWKDRDSVYQGGNSVFLELVGMNSVDELRGLRDEDMPLRDRAEEFVAGDRAVMQSGRASLKAVERIEYPDGTLRWLESCKYPIFDETGGIVGIVGTFVDITREKEAAAAQRRQLASIEATADAIAFIEQGVVRYANGAWARQFGVIDARACLGRPLLSFYPRREVVRMRGAVQAALHADGSWQGELEARRPDGSTFHQGLSVTRTDDEALICVCRDISELKAAREKIEHNALHDDLTGLPNRRLLTERIDVAIQDLRRHPDRQFAVLYLDLDRFKIVNDSLGHAVGDKLLIEIAQKLRANRRATDVIARLGGDEFVVLLNDVRDAHHVAQLAEAIIDHLSAHTLIDGKDVFTGVSMGVVLASERYRRAGEVLRDADIAMYRAKRESRSAFKFFDEKMFHQVRDRLTIETELRRAIRDEQLTVFYQPIVDLKTERVHGCEALVRWPHSDRGMIPPDRFIPIAEESGVVADIDEWVMRTACRQVRDWQARIAGAESLTVGVNISAGELRDRQIVALADEVLRDTGLDGPSLCLELTERVLVDDVDLTIDVLSRLASRGVRISIDDFGTGYSSFSYLHKLPVHSFKIDRSFIGAMDTSESSYKVARLIVTLSRELALNVVAEGVETDKQRDLLRALNCRYAQGYFFSRPLPAAEFETFLLGQVPQT